MKNLLDVPGIDEPYNAPRQVLPLVYWQTGHIDALRTATILGGSMSGKTVYPLVIDPRYTVDLDSLNDWVKAEWLSANGGLEYVSPGAPRRPMPEKIQLVVLDFDGVLTDNRVWTDQDGHEMVASNRSDSLGLGLLRSAGVQIQVISKEVNPVVAARCKKMKVPCLHGIDDKASALKKLLADSKIDPACTVFVGNDLNDLPCFPIVGWSVAVADALPEVIRHADFVLTRKGGHGAVRELCDLIIKRSEA